MEHRLTDIITYTKPTIHRPFNFFLRRFCFCCRNKRQSIGDEFRRFHCNRCSFLRCDITGCQLIFCPSYGTSWATQFGNCLRYKVSTVTFTPSHASDMHRPCERIFTISCFVIKYHNMKIKMTWFRIRSEYSSASTLLTWLHGLDSHKFAYS